MSRLPAAPSPAQTPSDPRLANSCWKLTCARSPNLHQALHLTVWRLSGRSSVTVRVRLCPVYKEPRKGIGPSVCPVTQPSTRSPPPLHPHPPSNPSLSVISHTNRFQETSELFYSKKSGPFIMGCIRRKESNPVRPAAHWRIVRQISRSDTVVLVISRALAM